MSLWQIFWQSFVTGWKRQWSGYCVYVREQGAVELRGTERYRTGCGIHTTLVSGVPYTSHKYCAFCGLKWRRP